MLDRRYASKQTINAGWRRAAGDVQTYGTERPRRMVSGSSRLKWVKPPQERYSAPPPVSLSPRDDMTNLSQQTPYLVNTRRRPLASPSRGEASRDQLEV